MEHNLETVLADLARLWSNFGSFGTGLARLASGKTVNWLGWQLGSMASQGIGTCSFDLASGKDGIWQGWHLARVASAKAGICQGWHLPRVASGKGGIWQRWQLAGWYLARVASGKGGIWQGWHLAKLAQNNITKILNNKCNKKFRIFFKNEFQMPNVSTELSNWHVFCLNWKRFEINWHGSYQFA